MDSNKIKKVFKLEKNIDIFADVRSKMKNDNKNKNVKNRKKSFFVEFPNQSKPFNYKIALAEDESKGNQKFYLWFLFIAIL